MLKRLGQNLFLKLFLSFLATCVLFFLGLAVFWNSYFSDLFYKDKKAVLEHRASDLTQVLRNVQEGDLSSRELRFSLRLMSRSFNGQIWIVDNRGMIVFSSNLEEEGLPIPVEFRDKFAQINHAPAGFTVEHLGGRTRAANYLTYYMPVTINGIQSTALFHTPVDDITEVISAVRMNIWLPLLFSLLAVGLILFILSRKLAGPLRQMNRASLAVAEGDLTTRVPIGSKDEVGQLAVSFNIMVDKLQQWEDTRQEFLANVSHELRSPLTTLRGMITAMQDQVIPAERHPHYLAICDAEVQRLQRLVNDLLDLAHIQNGTDVFRLAEVDLLAVSREVIDLLAPVIKGKGQELEVWIPEGGEPLPLVRLDPDRYAQILNNLLYNAIKFTPEGKRIIVRLGVRNGEFELQVRDTGIGMSQEDLRRIWDRFYKADPSRAGVEGGGTGLGLTIVKHLVTGMDGTIDVTSKQGEGTVFSVRFPLAG